jgi:hypothetical protein
MMQAHSAYLVNLDTAETIAGHVQGFKLDALGNAIDF